LATTSLSARKDRAGNGAARIVEFYVTDPLSIKQTVLRSGFDYNFVMRYEKKSSNNLIKDAIGSISVNDGNGQPVLLFRSSFSNQNFALSSCQGLIECSVRDLNLAPGRYYVNIFLSRGENEVMDYVIDAAEISVEGGDYFGTGSVGIPQICKVLSRANWRCS
jgi:lipopolysaccharide transport system ATP-binding protein